MTNEVEQMILKRSNINSEIDDVKLNTYNLYKDIWEFILNIYDNKFNTINLKFFVNNSKIDLAYGIKYKIDNNTYDKCFISNNDKIDVYLLFKLLRNDGFYVYYYDDGPILIKVEINKYDIEKNIENVLLKNKVLKLEKGILV